MTEFEKLECGDRAQITLVSSGTFDSAPSFAFFDSSGTLVASYTAVASATNAYYVFATIPNTPAYYYYEWLFAQGGYDQIRRGVFEAVKTTVVETGLYCNANDVRNLYKPLSDSDMRNTEIDEFIRDVQNEVNTRIGHIYSVPFAASALPPAITTITKNLALVSILERKGGAELPEWVRNRDERFRDLLSDIASGVVFLTLSSGVVLEPSLAALNKAHHSMADYTPTFNQLPFEEQRVDPDRIIDEEDAL